MMPYEHERRPMREFSHQHLLLPGDPLLLLTAGNDSARPRKRSAERKIPPPKEPLPRDPEVSDISQRDLHEVDPREPAATRPDMAPSPPKGGPPRATKR